MMIKLNIIIVRLRWRKGPSKPAAKELALLLWQTVARPTACGVLVH